jgi:ATP-dependent Clp protease adaptor protein ClpS
MRAKTETRSEEDTDLSTSLSGGYGVFVHNDDITPYDFVIGVLIRFFKLNAEDAEAITLTAHNSGIALVAVLPLSDAQAKVGRAHFAASLEGYPLTFTIEAE